MITQEFSVVAQIKVKPENLAEVKEALLKLQCETRKEAGCICFDVHQGIEDENVFIFYETWADKSALDNHFHSPHFKNWEPKAQRMTLGPPQAILMRKL